MPSKSSGSTPRGEKKVKKAAPVKATRGASARQPETAAPQRAAASSAPKPARPPRAPRAKAANTAAPATSTPVPPRSRQSRGPRTGTVPAASRPTGEAWSPSGGATPSPAPISPPPFSPSTDPQAGPRERRRRNAIARAKALQAAPPVPAPAPKPAPQPSAAPAGHRKGRAKHQPAPPEPRPQPSAKPKPPRLTDDPEALADRVLELIREAAPKQLDKVDLTKRLGLKPDARNLVREALRAHEQAGRIVPTSGGRYGLPATQGLIEGTYVAHEGGFGFVIVPDSESPDIFIPERHAANALHRDKVLVRLRKPRGEEDRRPGHHKKKKDKNAPKPRGHDPLPGEKLEGEIVRILVRANPTLVGTVQRDARSRHLLLTPDETRISRPVQVLPLPGTHLPDARELQNKKVLVRLLEWDSPWDPLKGELLEVLGDASDPEVALQALIRKYRLPLEFPDDVQAEANRIPARIPEKEAKRRLDLREEFIFTIDPETARDFDDAIHIHRGKNGEGYEVGIHIADVSNYVYPGTALDREARVRGNSTYLVDRVIPMIPERLSNGICSLVPNEDRLTRTVLLKADGKGRVISAKFAETVINSKVRLTYPQALGLLEKPDGTKISDAVNLAWEFAGKVRQRRFANGALDLDFPDVSVILDDAGHPVELRREENDISHQLIEEFMLLANEAVAKATREHSLASVYRVHNEPDEEKLAEFRMVLQSYGFSVGDLTQRKELQKFLSQLRGHSEESALKVALLKSLKRALYDTKPEGHYGLAKADYTHFTSPIRRYADLVVHRVLLKLIEKKPSQRQSTLSAGQMGKIAEHISETERVATEAERESKKLKQLEYLKRVIEEAPKGTTPRFQAVVTDIRGFGAFVELPDMLISGLLRQQDLRDWGYYPDSGRGGFVERRTDKLLRIGSEITVEVMDIDLLRKQVNFMLVSEEGKASGGKASAKSRERGQKRGYRR